MNPSKFIINMKIRSLRNLVNHFCTAPKEIVIPKRIPRGPTDILQALEATVGRDPTAPHYKYHDDPYLIPMSNIGKRTFAMAQEAGRKAAHWIRQEHADLFQHQVADPPIKAFMPKAIYTEDSQVTEDTLKQTINDIQVTNAITVYKILQKNNTQVAPETLQSFLELLCFYNSDDPLPEEFIEERWFRHGSKGRDRFRKTWKDGDMAETIFNSMKEPTSAAYCALIQGMAKYYQVDRAWQLYQETREKNLPVYTSTYNSLIRVACFLKEGYDLRWKFVKDLLISMAREGLKPDIGTLNAVLEALSTMANYKFTKKYVLQTLSEFKQLGIEPSLGSWYYVLIIFCRERGSTNYILNNIMSFIEGKEFEIQDVKDTFFFVTAMDVCRNHLNDKLLADRVHALLHTGANYDLIGDSYKESIYYRHYVALLCHNEPLDVFMKHYKQLVPNVYIPEPGLMSEILQVINMNGAIEYVPKMWSDMILFDHTDRENLLQAILNIMVSNPPSESSEMTEQFAKIAWDIWTKIDEQPEGRVKKLNFTGKILSNIMTLCLRAENFGRACQVMDKLDKSAHEVVGVPDIDTLKMFVETCVQQKSPSRAINCVEYCVENGYSEAGNLGKYITDNMTLDEHQTNKLVNLVGRDVLQLEKQTS